MHEYMSASDLFVSCLKRLLAGKTLSSRHPARCFSSPCVVIQTLGRLKNLDFTQSMFVRLLKVAWISTILKVLVDLAEGKPPFIPVVLNFGL